MDSRCVNGLSTSLITSLTACLLLFRFWGDPRVIPLYGALVSVVLLAIYTAYTCVHEFPKDVNVNPSHPEHPSNGNVGNAPFTTFVFRHGGPTIFGFELARLVICVTLSGLALASAIRPRNSDAVAITQCLLYVSKTLRCVLGPHLITCSRDMCPCSALPIF